MQPSGIEPHSYGDVVELFISDDTSYDEEAGLKLAQNDAELNFEHPTERPRLTAAFQEHENDFAEVVLVSEPEGATITAGGLHPRASLYERPVNLDTSKKQHANFRRILRSYGVKGHIKADPQLQTGFHSADDRFINARMELEEMAMGALSYTLNPAYRPEELSPEDRHSLSDDYKRTVHSPSLAPLVRSLSLQVLQEMSVDQLLDILMVHPTVEVTPTSRNTGLEAKYEYRPLSNLIYTRDQQITTAKGVVMGRLHSSQRQKEMELLSFCFQKLGIPVLGAVSEPGFLEGGDFFPAGLDLCFVGIGLRSNTTACLQLMSMDWFGTQRVAIVKDLLDLSQDRMHLDCVFSITGFNSCLMLEDIIPATSSKCRLVDEYRRNPVTQRYELMAENVPFSSYVQKEGYEIIPVTSEDQLKYACNVLNLGHGRIISVNAAASRKMVDSPHFHGRVEAIDFSSITHMYGAVHCSTQVLKRRSGHTSTGVSPSKPIPPALDPLRLN